MKEIFLAEKEMKNIGNKVWNKVCDEVGNKVWNEVQNKLK